MNTWKTFLMYKPSASSNYEKVVDVRDYPDVGGAPELLDRTTLTDPTRTYEDGIEEIDSSGLPFTANYSKADYTKLKTLEGTEYEYAIWFGGTQVGDTVTPTGVDGKWKFKGKLRVYVNGGGVNEVRSMTITVANTTAVVPDDEDEGT